MHLKSYITKSKAQNLVYHMVEISSGVSLLYIIILKSIKQIWVQQFLDTLSSACLFF